MDIRDVVFSQILHEEMTAMIVPEREGVLSGIEEATEQALRLGLTIVMKSAEGDRICSGEPIMILKGTPKQMALAEELLLGFMTKTSGIATAAAAFNKAATGKFQVICGAWKKVNTLLKEPYRRAIVTGGCGCRLLDEPMVYLDKNYVAMLGGVQEMLGNVPDSPELSGRAKVVQIKGGKGEIALACWTAAEFGADVIYVDTGRIEDFAEIEDALRYMKRIPRIAFAGGVIYEDIERLKECPVDIVGVGRGIIDAPMLDMRFDVVPVVRSHSCSGQHSVSINQFSTIAN